MEGYIVVWVRFLNYFTCIERLPEVNIEVTPCYFMVALGAKIYLERSCAYELSGMEDYLGKDTNW
jgi:hypothetical protein